ncbi:hypothetical protein HanXRQr2_Chr03g0125421 [Helianthus annuus]|uniref:Uncharacterized protein n=1 Tax=Helianthus annuus TaxID=4232 RepID=A0A9K3JIA8_HELAN|nr:hypothetical protein HanXRQr2_Chr03g0125421 [Helianthus annuus]KAJ0602162.1 hypothetical protein HanIR_Chr03g0136591 [Helianthus annuus]
MNTGSTVIWLDDQLEAAIKLDSIFTISMLFQCKVHKGIGIWYVVEKEEVEWSMQMAVVCL